MPKLNQPLLKFVKLCLRALRKSSLKHAPMREKKKGFFVVVVVFNFSLYLPEIPFEICKVNCVKRAI